MWAHFGGGAEMADPVAVGNGFQGGAKAVEMKATEAIVALNHDGATAGGEANPAIFNLGVFIVVGAGAVPPLSIDIVPHLELTFIVHNFVVEDAPLGFGRRVAPLTYFPLVVVVVVLVVVVVVVVGRMVFGVSEAEARRAAAGGIGGGKGSGRERKDRRWGRIEFLGPQTPLLLRGGVGHGGSLPSPSLPFPFFPPPKIEITSNKQTLILLLLIFSINTPWFFSYFLSLAISLWSI